MACGRTPRGISHATQMLLAGVHPKVARERLGHSTITTTLDLYSHVTDTMQSDAAARRCLLRCTKRAWRGGMTNLGSNLGSRQEF